MRDNPSPPGFSTLVNQYRNGFYITFSNGYKVSVQFGVGAYRDQGTAEVAVFTPWGAFVPFGDGEDVKGWQSPEDVLDLFNRVASFKPKSELIQ